MAAVGAKGNLGTEDSLSTLTQRDQQPRADDKNPFRRIVGRLF